MIYDDDNDNDDKDDDKGNDENNVTLTFIISSACLAWATRTASKPFLAFRWVQHTVTLFFVSLEIIMMIVRQHHQHHCHHYHHEENEVTCVPTGKRVGCQRRVSHLEMVVSTSRFNMM